jgi:Zn finger protein HypA/HybF involved in hydrogenase expression
VTNWEFVAIAAKLTNGIGVYRPVNDRQLKMFFVITKVITNEAAKNIKDKFVKCGSHDYGRRAFVCKHLNNESKVGFEEAFETFEDMELLEDDDFQAWCDECEAVRQREGEWNDKSMEFASIKVICETCYFEMKEINLGHR